MARYGRGQTAGVFYQALYQDVSSVLHLGNAEADGKATLTASLTVLSPVIDFGTGKSDGLANVTGALILAKVAGAIETDGLATLTGALTLAKVGVGESDGVATVNGNLTGISLSVADLAFNRPVKFGAIAAAIGAGG